jgi:hypothetical protein
LTRSSGRASGPVTKRRAVFCFAVGEAAERVGILAVFFGGPDHPAEMLRRRACG